MRPEIILMLAFCVLVCAVVVFLWKDSGYYKQTLDKYGEIILTQKIWKTEFDANTARVKLVEQTNENLKKEVDTLYQAFQNVCAEQLRMKNEPPKPIVISPIEVSIVRKKAPNVTGPKITKVPPKREPVMKTNRVKSKVKEAKENAKGL